MRSKRTIILLAGLVLPIGPTGGCTKTPSAELRDGLKVVAHERDPARLAMGGEAFASIGDFGRAAQYYSAALEQGGDEGIIVPKLIDVYVRDKQYRAACWQAKTYLQKHPQETSLRFVLANLSAGLGDPTVARQELEQVVREEPSNANAHYALAVLLRDEAADLSSADEHFREYLRLSPAGPHADEARGALLKRVR